MFAVLLTLPSSQQTDLMKSLYQCACYLMMFDLVSKGRTLNGSWNCKAAWGSLLSTTFVMDLAMRVLAAGSRNQAALAVRVLAAGSRRQAALLGDRQLQQHSFLGHKQE